MGISSYGLLIFLLIVQFTVSAVGGYAGYTVKGVPVAGTLSTGDPGIFGVVEWVWDSVTFMFDMMAFRIDGMPELVSVVFLILGLLTAFLVVKLVRGS